MLKRHWFETGIYSLVLILFIASAIVQAQKLRSHYFEDRQNIAAQQAEHIQSSLKTCLAAGGASAQQDCRATADAAALRFGVSREDLKIQQDISVWAFSALATTVVTFLLSAGGLIFVYLTWREAKRTGDDAREIGQKQVRAYVADPDVTFSPGEYMTGFGGHVTVTWKNTGQSPALHCSEMAEVIFVDNTGAYDDLSAHLKSLEGQPNHSASISANGTLSLGPFPVLAGDYQLWKETKKRMLVHSLIRYHDVFGAAHYTEACVMAVIVFDRMRTPSLRFLVYPHHNSAD